jgi:hypothetical protein
MVSIASTPCQSCIEDIRGLIKSNQQSVHLRRKIPFELSLIGPSKLQKNRCIGQQVDKNRSLLQVQFCDRRVSYGDRISHAFVRHGIYPYVYGLEDTIIFD